MTEEVWSFDVGVSINGGTPELDGLQWIMFLMNEWGGTPILGNLHVDPKSG